MQSGTSKVEREEVLTEDIAIGIGTVAFNFLGLLKLLRDVNEKEYSDGGMSRSASTVRTRTRKIRQMICCSPLSYEDIQIPKLDTIGILKHQQT